MKLTQVKLLPPGVHDPRDSRVGHFEAVRESFSADVFDLRVIDSLLYISGQGTLRTIVPLTRVEWMVTDEKETIHVLNKPKTSEPTRQVLPKVK